ncbi:hypothetical protein POTOM_016836 [Populus tomentosa]|uniref:Uncharacterized protein n=1 Tax=Populus tomentosa TaxID=118781 RepID=A0A8X8D475_POPTO|nr:hypothetical protein POTOM_016836 [Populus tomentosa]
MGSVINIAANGIGGVLGNAFAVPIKTILGASCYLDAPLPTVQGGDLPTHGKNEAFARGVGLHVKHIRCIMKTKECKTASISWIEKSSKRSWSFQKNGDFGDCRSEILKALMP